MQTLLLLIIATLPSYLIRFEILGIPSTLLEGMLLLFFIVWTITRRPSIKQLLPPTKHLLPILLLLLAACIGTLISPNTTSAIGILKAYFIEPIILFLILRYEFQQTNTQYLVSNIYKILSLSTLILSLIAIYQYATGTGIPIPWDIERRVTSIFDYPNALGLFLGPIVIITTLKGIQTIKNKHRTTGAFYLTTALTSSLAIILAQSEAAIVATIATLLIASIVHKRTRTIGIALSILIAVIAMSYTPIRAKLLLKDYSGGVRLTQWYETSDLIQDNWLLGTGLSGYPQAFEPYHTATHIEIFQYPHNIILNIWTELGLLGLIAVAWLGYILIKPSGKHPLSTNQVIAILALVQMTIHGLVDVPYFKNDLAILTWILIAIALYAPHLPTHKTSS